jgi:hypothetical protein
MFQKSLYVRFLYWLMYRFMDLESIMWWVADHFIYPVARIRRLIASIINKKVIKPNLEATIK